MPKLNITTAPTLGQRNHVVRNEITKIISNMVQQPIVWNINDDFLSANVSISYLPYGISKKNDTSLQVILQLEPAGEHDGSFFYKNQAIKKLRLFFRFSETIVKKDQANDKEKNGTPSEVFETNDVVTNSKWIGTEFSQCSLTKLIIGTLTNVSSNNIALILANFNKNKLKRKKNRKHRRSPV